MKGALFAVLVSFFFMASAISQSSDLEDAALYHQIKTSVLNSMLERSARNSRQWPITVPHQSMYQHPIDMPTFPFARQAPQLPTSVYDDIESMETDDDDNLKVVDFRQIGGMNTPILYPASKGASPNDLGDFFRIFSGITSQPWWKGPNVCVEREETDDSDDDEDSDDGDDDLSEEGDMLNKFTINMQTCSQSVNRYECVHKDVKDGVTKSYTIRYKCCHGYQRYVKGNTNCQKVELLSLIETIKKLNGSEFLKIAEDLEDVLKKENLTVFLPSNEAFKEFADMLLQTNQIELVVPAARRRRNVNGISTTQLIQAHMSKGFEDISADDTYYSLFDNSTLHIKDVNMHSMEPKYLVNCARIISSNTYATRGIVHTVDKVLMPVTRTIAQIISETPNLSTLNSILKKTGLATSLDGTEIWTIFAPTNAAFEKLNPALLSKFMNGVGDTCVTNVIKHHMLSNAFCSANVKLNKHIRIKNALGELLDMTMPSSKDSNKVETMMNDPVFLVDAAPVSHADITATNGVIHIIDDIKIPDNAQSITTLLQKNKLTKFYDAIVKAGMLDEVENLSNVTFFVPTDKAIDDHFSKEDSQETKRIVELSEIQDRPSQKNLRSFVLHHITKGALQSCDMSNNLMSKTYDNDKDIRVNLYSTMPLLVSEFTYNRATVDCARLLHFDAQQCDNILHQIDRPLMPVEGTIMDMIREKPELSMLNEIINNTDIELILSTSNQFTFIAPTNDAFEKLGKTAYDMMLSSKPFTEKLLKQHIIRGVVCCTALKASWPFSSSLNTLNGNSLIIGNNKIGNSNMTHCDDMATNGVIHFTDNIMLPVELRKKNILDLPSLKITLL